MPHTHSVLISSITHQSGTFVTVCEPTLTHQHHPEFLPSRTAHSCGFGQCVMTCNHHVMSTEQLHCPQTPLCPACSALPGWTQEASGNGPLCPGPAWSPREGSEELPKVSAGWTVTLEGTGPPQPPLGPGPEPPPLGAGSAPTPSSVSHSFLLRSHRYV